MEESGAALAKEIMEQEEREQRLASLAKDVVMVLVKTIRATKLYLPNNPVYIKFREELKERLDIFFNEEGSLSLRVDRFSLTFMGLEVYNNPDMEDNIALMFFKDGVREICFHRGITDEELTGLIDILKFDVRGHELDDDLVTLMWEKDFQNISYTTADDWSGEEAGWGEDEYYRDEDGAAGNPELTGRALQEETQDNARAYEGAGQGGNGGGITGVLDPQALNDGLEAIRGSFNPPDDLALLTHLTRIFYDILLTEPDGERFGTVIDSIGRALEIFVGKGDLELATVLVKKVEELGRDERLRDRRQALDVIAIRACSASVIKKVGECLEQGGPETVDRACGYLRQLDSRAAGPMIGLLETVRDRRTRKALCDVLVGQCAGSGRPLLPFLAHRSWYVVRNVVMVLGLVADPDSVPALATALRHPEPKVRREAVHALGQIKGDRAEELLEEALRDTASAIRVFAGRLLAMLDPERAFGCFARLVSEKGFEERPFEEQKEFCELMGRSGRDKAVPLLAERFGRKGLFGLFRKEQTRASAAYGLAAVGGEEAYALLRSESGSKSKMLRDACRGGLKRLDKTREAEDAG